jgi:hypothetical protein
MNSNNTERMLLNELARVTAKLQLCERKMQQMKLNARLRNNVLRNNGSRNNAPNNTNKRKNNTVPPQTRTRGHRYDLRPLPHRKQKLFGVYV